MATKTGGGLLGRADSTLVQGALKAELANVGPSMQGVYKMQAENVTNLQTAVQDFFYAFDKSNNDLRNEVKELTPKLLADIETGTYIDDSYVDLVSQEINSLRKQMKSIPKGREGEAERAKIRTRLANIKAESGSAEQTMTKIATLIDNDQIDFNSLQTGDMELWKSILDKSAKREFVDGKLVYSTNINGKELKISHSDLEKRFVPKQYGVQSNALKLSNGFINVGKQGLAYDFNGAMNAYETLMTNKQEVLGLINNPFGSMQYSFTDALKGKDSKLVGELLGALNTIGGFNVEGDEKPDKITMSNLNKLVSTLTNPDDDNFNLATTKRVAAAFYADNDGRIQYNKGKSLFDAKQPSTPQAENNSFSSIATNKGQVKLSAGNYIDAATLDSFATKIKNRDTFDYGSDGKYYWDGDSYVAEKGGKKQKIAKKGLLKALTNTENFDVRFMESTAYKNVEDWYNPNEFDKDRQLGLNLNFDISDLGVDDNTVRDNLNLMLPAAGAKGNRKGYEFRLTRRGGESGLFRMGDFSEDAIQLVDPKGTPVGDKIMTNLSDPNEQQAELVKLRKLLSDNGLLDNLKPLVK